MQGRDGVQKLFTTTTRLLWQSDSCGLPPYYFGSLLICEVHGKQGVRRLKLVNLMVAGQPWGIRIKRDANPDLKCSPDQQRQKSARS